MNRVTTAHALVLFIPKLNNIFGRPDPRDLNNVIDTAKLKGEAKGRLLEAKMEVLKKKY